MDRRGGSGGRAAWDEKNDAVAFEKLCELLTGGGRVLIGAGEHGSVAGLFHVAAQGRFVLVVFLDEISDLPPQKLFFQMQELLEIEATGHTEKTGGRHTVGMENLDGRHSERLLRDLCLCFRHEARIF